MQRERGEAAIEAEALHARLAEAQAERQAVAEQLLATQQEVRPQQSPGRSSGCAVLTFDWIIPSDSPATVQLLLTRHELSAPRVSSMPESHGCEKCNRTGQAAVLCVPMCS